MAFFPWKWNTVLILHLSCSQDFSGKNAKALLLRCLSRLKRSHLAIAAPPKSDLRKRIRIRPILNTRLLKLTHVCKVSGQINIERRLIMSCNKVEEKGQITNDGKQNSKP